MQREARYDLACQQGKDEQVIIKSKCGYRILNDILSCWTYYILDICLVLLFQILWMYFSSCVSIFKVWLKIKSLWFRGFCVCTQNKILYFQYNKFHWVENLRESFNTLDRRATIISAFVKIFSQINISVVFTHAFKIKSFINMCMWIITH